MQRYPSAFQFVGSLKAQILNNLIYTTTHTNCEMDNNVLLSNLKSFLGIEEYNEGEAEVLETPEMATEETVCRLEEDVNRGSSETFSVAYVAGFILKGIYKKITCLECSSLLSSDELETHNMYIWCKEWSDDSRKLNYPSTLFTISIGQGINSLENFMRKNSVISDLPNHAYKFIHNDIDLTWMKCGQHHEEVQHITVQSIVNIGIPWWVKRQNQRLKNLRNEKIQSKKLKKLKNI